MANFPAVNNIALKCVKPVATYFHVKSHVDFTCISHDVNVAILDDISKTLNNYHSMHFSFLYIGREPTT